MFGRVERKEEVWLDAVISRNRVENGVQFWSHLGLKVWLHRVGHPVRMKWFPTDVRNPYISSLIRRTDSEMVFCGTCDFRVFPVWRLVQFDDEDTLALVEITGLQEEPGYVSSSFNTYTLQYSVLESDMSEGNGKVEDLTGLIRKTEAALLEKEMAHVTGGIFSAYKAWYRTVRSLRPRV